MKVECPLCDSHATREFDDPTSTFHFDCEKCGEYKFYEILFTTMRAAQHWEQTRKRLAEALSKPGVVKDRVFEEEIDIVAAIGDYDRAIQEEALQRGE